MPFRDACTWSSSVCICYFLCLQRNPIWEQHHHNEPVCLMFVASVRPRMLNRPLELQDFLWILVLCRVFVYICVCACFRGVYCEWSSVRLRIWNWFSISGSDFLNPARSQMYKFHHSFMKLTGDIFSFPWTLMVVPSTFWFAVWSMN